MCCTGAAQARSYIRSSLLIVFLATHIDTIDGGIGLVPHKFANGIAFRYLVNIRVCTSRDMYLAYLTAPMRNASARGVATITLGWVVGSALPYQPTFTVTPYVRYTPWILAGHVVDRVDDCTSLDM
jgi:hypothetical protein